MKNLRNALILLCFISAFAYHNTAQAERKGFKLFPPSLDWSKNHKEYRAMKGYNPYLENSRHLQIPQWAHKDWMVEDWTSQIDGITLIQGWYAADILRNQVIGHAKLPVLVVGPNFYHLSGLDKRRVVTTIDVTYGITTEQGSIMLTDWYTNMPIGVFDEHGLRLH